MVQLSDEEILEEERMRGPTKLHSLDSVKMQIIQRHCQTFHDLKQGIGTSRVTKVGSFSKNKTKPAAAKFADKLPKNASEMRFITLEDLMQDNELIDVKMVMINLTLIEDPLFMGGVHLVAEDENGDVTKLSVYNVPHTDDTARSLAFGRRLSVIRPHIKFCLDGTTGIRVSDPRKLVLKGKANVCLLCAEERAKILCENCVAGRYCSENCYAGDWRLLQRNLICAYEHDEMDGVYMSYLGTFFKIMLVGIFFWYCFWPIVYMVHQFESN